MKNSISTLPIAKSTYSTYAVAGRESFYGNVPEELKPIHQRAKSWLAWGGSGFVPGWHITGSGIPQTNIGVSIKKQLGRILVDNLSLDSDDTKIEILQDWIKREKFNGTLKVWVDYTIGGGTSLLKLSTEDNEIYPEVYSVEEFYADIDRRGRVREASIFIDLLKTKEGKYDKEYWIIEKRFYKDGKPFVKYYISRSSLAAGEFVDKQYLAFVNLPNGVKDWARNHGVQFDIDIELPFADLGIYALKLTEGLSGIPGSTYGESLLADCISDLFSYEFNESNKLSDEYVGRGRIMVPKDMMSNGMGALSGFDGDLFMQIPDKTLEGFKPQALQFEYRTEEHNKNRDSILETIAGKIGVDASTLFAHLSRTGNKTAREISSETDKTVSFVMDKRNNYILPAVKKVLDAVAKHNGLIIDYSVSLPSASLTSVDVRVSHATQLVNAGLATVEDGLKILYPDMSSEDITRKANRIKQERKEVEPVF